LSGEKVKWLIDYNGRKKNKRTRDTRPSFPKVLPEEEEPQKSLSPGRSRKEGGKKKAFSERHESERGGAKGHSPSVLYRGQLILSKNPFLN